MAAKRDHTCSVCLELFSEPKVLPCCHTFCLKCLEKTAQNKGEIPCPQCRKTHAIPAGGLTEFLTDFIASYEIEVAGLKSSKGAETLTCSECEGAGPVESYCSDCQNYLCNECGSQLHKRLKAYREHKVIPIEEVNVATLQSSQVQNCSAHKGEALKLYCETCMKLVCRDCTLVEHRQHTYTFVHDARQQVDARMASLSSEVKQKLDVLKKNLDEIKKVETAACGHLEVLKADINAFFDKLVQSIDVRRKQLLTQAEAECQKDLKQIWAGKDFHETTISQISSVFGLTDIARKCTGDAEMILTALQSIRQLMQIKETEWDGRAFTKVVSLTTKFTEGQKIEMDAAGSLGRVSAQRFDLQFMSYPPIRASLGTSISFKVAVKSPPRARDLVDGRSGMPIHLQGVTPLVPDPKAIVNYGNSQKELDSAHVSVVKVLTKKPPRKSLWTFKNEFEEVHRK